MNSSTSVRIHSIHRCLCEQPSSFHFQISFKMSQLIAGLGNSAVITPSSLPKFYSNIFGMPFIIMDVYNSVNQTSWIHFKSIVLDLHFGFNIFNNVLSLCLLYQFRTLLRISKMDRGLVFPFSRKLFHSALVTKPIKSTIHQLSYITQNTCNFHSS